MLKHELISRERMHQILYINWQKEAKKIYLDINEYHDKLLEIRTKYTRHKVIVSGQKTRRNYFLSGEYDEYVPVDKRRSQYRIYVRDFDGTYFIYACSKDGKKLDQNIGTESYKEVKNKFKERTKKTLLQTFGKSDYNIRECIPRPLEFINPFYLSTKGNLNVINDVSSIDGCSQYPTALSGKLPTTNDAKVIKGQVSPTAEYPFAIYLKSHHVASYNEFDTRKWIYEDCSAIIFKNNWIVDINPEDDETLLMKASDYSLKPEMEYYFNLKESSPKGSKERDLAKAVMNSFIGFLHRKKECSYNKVPFNHLAAIAITRANDRLIKKLRRIKPMDLLHVCVDGFIYKGHQVFGTDERKLGNFEQEYLGGSMVMTGTNGYIVKSWNGEIIKVAHQANNYNLDGTKIDDNPPKDFSDIFNWTRTDNSCPDYESLKEYRKGEL